MIIIVDAVCRNCGRNDPVSYAIASWSSIRVGLTVRSLWECPNCGSKAAYWYFYRNRALEEPPAPSEENDYWQVFAETTDSGMGIGSSPNFVAEFYNPETHEELP